MGPNGRASRRPGPRREAGRCSGRRVELGAAPPSARGRARAAGGRDGSGAGVYRDATCVPENFFGNCFTIPEARMSATSSMCFAPSSYALIQAAVSWCSVATT